MIAEAQYHVKGNGWMERRMNIIYSRQTFSHDIIEELHDGNPPIRVAVEQLPIHPGCEKLSEGENQKRDW